MQEKESNQEIQKGISKGSGDKKTYQETDKKDDLIE